MPMETETNTCGGCGRGQGEDPFRLLIEDCIQGILIHKDFTPRYVNRSFAGIHGYSIGEIHAMGSILPLIWPEDRRRVIHYHNLRSGGKDAPQDYEYRAVRKDGGTVWIENRVKTIHWNGEPAVQVIAYDISKRKQIEMSLKETEAELRKSRDRLEEIVFSMPNGIFIVDAATHNIADINPQALAMIGGSPEAVVGRECHEFICPNARGRCPITDLGKEVAGTETTLLTADGKQIPILKTVIPVVIDGQRLLIESFVDLTSQKKAEAARIEQERLNGIFELAGAVCHELNQPLMSIAGYAELLLMDLRPQDKPYRYAGAIGEQVERMGRITRKLMGITHYQTKDYLDSKIIDLEGATAGKNPPP